jgi:hypothetical protein
MEAIRDGFAPSLEDLDTHVKQAAAFRAGSTDRPYYEVLEEERLNEGTSRAIEFSRQVADMHPSQRATLGPLAAALLKVGPSLPFKDIIEAAQQEDGSVYQFSKHQRQKANQILAVILETQAGEGRAFRDPTTPLIPEDQKDPTQALEEGREAKAGADAEQAVRDAAHESQAAEGERRTRVLGELIDQYGDVKAIPQDVLRESGLTEPTGPTDPIFSISRDLKPATVARFVKDLAQVPFEAEQQTIAVLTRPVLEEALLVARVPHAETIAKYGSEVLVPTSAVPFARATKGVSLLRRAAPRAVQEGIINVMQNRAGKDARREPPPDPVEDLTMLAFGLAVGGLGPEVLSGLGRAIDNLKADPAIVHPAAEIAPPVRGSLLEPAGVRVAPDVSIRTGDTVALRTAPSASIGRVIAQSEQGVTIRPDTGPAFLRSRGRVQVVEDVSPVVRPETPVEPAVVEPARAAPMEPGAAPARATPRDIPAAGTKEFTERSLAVRARLQAILDDPSQPKSVKRNTQKLFDRVCK